MRLPASLPSSLIPWNTLPHESAVVAGLNCPAPVPLEKRLLMVIAEMHDAARPTSVAQPVDNTDWLKTAAIILVLVDHFGYFFVEDDQWWGVFGRMGAPPFFFLMGYARTRTVPLRWIWLGVGLTVLDSWNNGWAWVAPNILLSFALIRVVLPYVRAFLQGNGWIAFALLVAAPLAFLPIAGEDCRLRPRGMALGAVQTMPAHLFRRQIGYGGGRWIPRLGAARARSR